MGKSSRSIKKKSHNITDRPANEPSSLDNSLQKATRANWINENKGINLERSNSKILRWGLVAALVFIVLLVSGVFSPTPNPGNNDFLDNEDLPDNIFTQANGEKISVVLYSSPTCGCCHEYVAYLNDNGFDTYQKRTEAYEDIKYENGIPQDKWSCHTAIIGDYFIEGHIPLSVVYDLLSETPDIDGISLPNMPSGSPGMEGQKNEDWVISSISNGQVIGIFATV